MRHLIAMRHSSHRGFTIIELLVAMAVLILLLAIIVGVTNSVSTTVRRASSGVDALAGARAGFDLVNQTLSQATLNTYWDYDNPLAPTHYLRQSDLQFLVRQNTQNANYGQEVYFVTPKAYAKDPALLSTAGLLNACGLYVRYGSNKDYLPNGIGTEKFRYRLMLAFQPTEQLEIFNRPARTASQTDAAYRSDVQKYWDEMKWILPLSGSGTNSSITPLADNIIAVIAWPRLPTAEDAAGLTLTPSGSYAYNSQATAMSVPQPITANQLPPVIQVTMIAISEASAARLDTNSSAAPNEIEQALSGKFTQVASYQQDLDDVAKALSDKHIEFQIFSTAVPLRESKWSKAQ